jgi:hypothetical protein
MGIVRTLPNLESWLDTNADSWFALSDPEYKALVRRWTESYSHLLATRLPRHQQGYRAMLSLEDRLPANVFLFSGLKVPQLDNLGGSGPAAYRAIGLQRLSRDLANQLELIVSSEDLAWSCIFSHEAGAWVWEQLYERGPSTSLRAGCHGLS